MSETQTAAEQAAAELKTAAEVISETAASVGPSLFNSRVIERRVFHESLITFRVKPDKGEVALFKPGQYVTLGLPNDPGAKPKMILRAYSIASSPNQREYMDFFIVLVDNGALTTRLWKLKDGDPIFLGSKIAGHFTLDEVPDGKDLVMISTGTGLAPYLSMFDTYRGQNRWRKFVMVNGVRYGRDLGYRSDLEALHAAGEICYIPYVTRDEEWKGLKGRVQLLLDGDTYEKQVGCKLDPENAHVFLCGSPDMIDQMEAALQQRGFKTHSKREPGNLHLERYW